MEKYILYFIGGLFTCGFCIICSNKLLDLKIDFKNYKIYLSTIILTLIGTIVNFTLPQFLKLFFVVIAFFIINYILL